MNKATALALHPNHQQGASDSTAHHVTNQYPHFTANLTICFITFNSTNDTQRIHFSQDHLL